MRRLLPLLLLAACASDPADEGGLLFLDAGVGGCPEGTSTCLGDVFQVCQGGRFVEADVCGGGEACLPGVGCVACDPALPAFCDGDTVYTCRPDGTRGDVVRTCPPGLCADGACRDDCAEGSELIYVVDVDDTLLSFDPRTEELRRVGTLRCPAGNAWPEFSRGEATPFSMAVERSGRAWVLYSSGEIFWVDIHDASCRASTFRRGEQGFELFGMSFVTDTPGRPEETLYLTGGAVESFGRGTLAAVDPRTVALTPIGPMPPGEYGAELTGNANGELWAYTPGLQSSVARIDKRTARAVDRWDLPPLPRQPAGWAFAHWGGRYYVFISTQGAAGGVASSQILRFNPVDGRTEVVVADAGRRIVGAGVSTCAPVVSNF
ncbi:MAG: hypothetical protein H6706_30465 [Myxococcales bacterium]|nr:hypothetical protein [Myxococcales bacterium]